MIGTVRVLEAARAAGARVVFTSSGGAIYGECERPAREDDELRPLSPYGASKLAGEEYLATWNRLHGAAPCRLPAWRTSSGRGSWQLEGGVVAIFLDRLRDGQETVIFGDGRSDARLRLRRRRRRGAARGAAVYGGGVFNVGTGTETSVGELHGLCAEVAGARRAPRFAAERPGDLRRSVIDPSRAARELGWRAGTILADGLAQTWNSVPAR